MSKIAEFLWNVAQDAGTSRPFGRAYAEEMITKYGEGLTDQQREALLSGESDRVTEILALEDPATCEDAESGWTLSIDEPEEPEPSEEPEVAAEPESKASLH